MQITEALNVLNDGHTIWKVAHAKRVCKALEVPFSNSLVWEFHSKDGYLMKKEGSLGVDGSWLSQYVAEELGVAKKAKSFIGSGSQSREFARVIREHLKEQGKI